MPLHLLGKKSWNVYNAENIERVKRDEAKAQAVEEQAERNRRREETEHRLKALRGTQDSIQLEDNNNDLSEAKNVGRKRKYNETEALLHPEEARKRYGRGYENKDFEYSRRKESGEYATGKDRLDSISNMKFRDAGGKHSSQPWYLDQSRNDDGRANGKDKDVWGNEDHRRQDRERERISANDPLLSMKKGVKQLRDVEKQRHEWKAQRERDLYEVEELARRHHRHRRRRHDNTSDKGSARKGDKHQSPASRRKIEDGVGEYKGDE